MGGRAKRRWAARGAALALVLGCGSLATSDAASPAEQVVASTHRASQVLAGGVAARATAPRVTARWVGSVNTSSRASVNTAYWRNYASGLEVPIGYSGDDSACQLGDTTVESRAATQRAINFVRSMGGLYPVSLNATLNARSQYTALMMSANKALSHYPSSSWRCYTATGASNAARSNLALGYPRITSAGVVGMYMRESGASNYAVGHRRWLMNPFTTAMGSGATETANAITVVGPRSYTRPNPRYVAWPTAGYFPNTLEPNGRWSLSMGNRALSFVRATVRVYRNGALVRTVKNPVRNGYAAPTLAWEMPDALARTGSFRVVVNNIRYADAPTRRLRLKRFSHSYPVLMFAPTR